jgi:hypothetical protein
MHNTIEIEKILKIGLYSGLLKGEKPLSLFLVADAGSGKTSLLNQFKSKTIWNVSDISQKSIAQNLKEKSKSGINHIVMGDFIAVQSHSYATVNAVMGMLNRLIEEGIHHEEFYGQHIDLDKRAVMGLITSTTIDKFEDLFVRYADIGFFDRVIPIFYKLSNRSIGEINHRLQKEISDYSEIKLNLGKKKIAVKIPLGIIADSILAYSVRITDLQNRFGVLRVSSGYSKVYKATDSNGIRMHRMLRVMAKSIAIINRGVNVKEVNASDIASLNTLYQYIGLRAKKDITEI